MFQQLQFYQIGTMDYQEVVPGAPVTRFFKFIFVSFFSVLFFGMKRGTLKSLIVRPSFLLFCRYLSS